MEVNNSLLRAALYTWGGRKWPPGKEFTGRVVRKVVIRNVDGKEAEHSWGESTGSGQLTKLLLHLTLHHEIVDFGRGCPLVNASYFLAPVLLAPDLVSPCDCERLIRSL